jgi:hypothetical protein
MLVAVLLLSLSLAMKDNEFNQGGGSGGGGIPAALVAAAAAVNKECGIQWRRWWGRSMAVAA